MSKIVTAINVMASNPDLITNVHKVKRKSGTEYLFIYDNKHLWSISNSLDTDDYYISYYPGNLDIKSLAQIRDDSDTGERGWGSFHQEPVYISYKSKDLGTKEAKESMRDLFNMISETAFGMDDILDEIINSHPIY